ncbi:MAG: RNA-binding protein [Clostridia bacterium]|nr:RNA-binding protein [Clostridia bacterium]
MNVFAGDIVYAKAGRDKDTPFVVLEVLDDEYVWLANGRRRKVEKPKKKKIKHLQKSKYTSLLVQEKLKNGGFVTNPDVKRALAEILNDHDA